MHCGAGSIVETEVTRQGEQLNCLTLEFPEVTSPKKVTSPRISIYCPAGR